MDKKTFTCILSICFLFIVTACQTTRVEYLATFEQDTISVALDDTYVYFEDGNERFHINQDKKQIFQASYTTPFAYEQYVREVDQPGSLIKRIKKGTKDNNSYIFYQTQHADYLTYTYVIRINDSKTAVVLVNKSDKKAAEECFSALSFSFIK